ncbi:ATP-binding protein [Dyella subtropica]|uniref:ATP-binding protein n=1 Tax=Dyella subtropica TaxID=2992127 RepID=UPI002253FFA8|nr:ATP-binding protein [Dyella subtropica]
MKPASLSSRITLLLLVTSLALLGGGALAMDWRIDREMEARYRETLLTQAHAVAAMTELEQDAGDGSTNLRPQAGLFGGEGPVFYELRCKGLPPLRSDPPPLATPPGWPDAASSEPQFSRLKHHDKRLGTVMFAFRAPAGEAQNLTGGGRGCALFFQQDRRPFEQILLAIDWILALGPILALGIALVAVPLIVRRGLRPVRALVARMGDIGPNAPGERLHPSGLRELDPLIRRFNGVLDRMDEGLARERQFASGLAHESRTRLAELRALTEVESRYPSGRTLPDILGEVGSIGAELEATVTALLLLTRLQSGLEQPQLQELSPAPWLERQLQRHRGLAADHGATLQLSGEPPARIRSDPALLEVIVGNLLSNACAYAPSGDTVELHVDGAGLTIINAAPDLTADDLERFGQRFWRKQAPHAGHAGLGLALAAAAAHALGLALAFRLDASRRLHARLSWPKHRADA